jgi:tetratricopeptide (TPR) repeat protein
MLEDRRKRPPDRRLDSWKEIAAYFGRDERTVKRWEKERGLPIRRLPGARGGVYAFSDDLAHWMEARDSGKPDPSSGSFALTQLQKTEASEPGETSPVELEDDAEAAADPTRLLQLPAASERSASLHRRGVGLVAVSVLIAAVLATVLFVLLSRKHVLASRSVTSDSGLTVAKVHQPKPEAQDLYLQGRYYWDKRTPTDLNKALAYFQQAIAVDPEYAHAYVGLADCYNLLREYALMPEGEAYPKAIAAAKKAVELDDSLADAHNSLAFGTFYWLFDAPTAEREFRRALSLNPNCSLAHHWYATFLMTIGRNQEALEQIEIAQQLDSSSRSILADKGLILYHAGRVEEGVALLKQLSETEPSFISPHRYLAAIYFELQRYPEYLAQASETARLSKDELELAILEDGAKGFRSGGSQMMLESMLRDQTKYYAVGRISAYRLAQTYSLLGRQHDAIAYLRIAHDRRDSALSGLLVDFTILKLHNDPAYRELVSQLGLPPRPGS